MSWKSGSALMSDIIDVLMEKIPNDQDRQEIYEAIIPCFEAHDCDTLQDCAEDDEAFHNALYEVDQSYRDWFDEMQEEYEGDTLDFDDEELEEDD
jgi:hypothetical protein